MTSLTYNLLGDELIYFEVSLRVEGDFAFLGCNLFDSPASAEAVSPYDTVLVRRVSLNSFHGVNHYVNFLGT